MQSAQANIDTLLGPLEADPQPTREQVGHAINQADRELGPLFIVFEPTYHSFNNLSLSHIWINSELAAYRLEVITLRQAVQKRLQAIIAKNNLAQQSSGIVGETMADWVRSFSTGSIDESRKLSEEELAKVSKAGAEFGSGVDILTHATPVENLSQLLGDAQLLSVAEYEKLHGSLPGRAQGKEGAADVENKQVVFDINVVNAKYSRSFNLELPYVALAFSARSLITQNQFTVDDGIHLFSKGNALEGADGLVVDLSKEPFVIVTNKKFEAIVMAQLRALSSKPNKFGLTGDNFDSWVQRHLYLITETDTSYIELTSSRQQALYSQLEAQDAAGLVGPATGRFVPTGEMGHGVNNKLLNLYTYFNPEALNLPESRTEAAPRITSAPIVNAPKNNFSYQPDTADEGQIAYELANNPNLSVERRAALMNRLNDLLNKDKAVDVALAAGGYHKPLHADVHRVVEEGLPDDLKNFSSLDSAEQARLKDKYRDADGQIVIPVVGLVRGAGLLGHIGLGRYYGEPVVYIDAALNREQLRQERAVVKAHEQYEINKWEEKRRELGLDHEQMRVWIIRNANTQGTGLAQQLAQQWHQEAPSVEQIYLQERINFQFQQGRVERALQRIQGVAEAQRERLQREFRDLLGIDLREFIIPEILSRRESEHVAMAQPPTGEGAGARIEILVSLAALLNDDELAWLVGHEFIHTQVDHYTQTTELGARPANKRDVIAQLLKDYSFMSKIMPISGWTENFQHALDLAIQFDPEAKIRLEALSQQEEKSADFIGALLTVLAGLDPEAAVSGFEKIFNNLDRLEGLLPSEHKMPFDSHPAVAQRVQDIAEYVSRCNLQAEKDIYENDVMLAAKAPSTGFQPEDKLSKLRGLWREFFPGVPEEVRAGFILQLALHDLAVEDIFKYYDAQLDVVVVDDEVMTILSPLINAENADRFDFKGIVIISESALQKLRAGSGAQGQTGPVTLATVDNAIAVLESRLDAASLKKIPRLGFHVEELGHQPEGNFWYYIFDPDSEYYAGIKTPEFFERLQGAVIRMLNFIPQGTLPEIYILKDTKKRSLFVTDTKPRNDNVTSVYPLGNRSSHRYLFTEGKSASSALPPELIVRPTITLTAQEYADAQNWGDQQAAAQALKDPDHLLAKAYLNRLLYKKTLEVVLALSEADAAAAERSVIGIKDDLATFNLTKDGLSIQGSGNVIIDGVTCPVSLWGALPVFSQLPELGQKSGYVTRVTISDADNVRIGYIDIEFTRGDANIEKIAEQLGAKQNKNIFVSADVKVNAVYREKGIATAFMEYSEKLAAQLLTEIRKYPDVYPSGIHMFRLILDGDSTNGFTSKYAESHGYQTLDPGLKYLMEIQESQAASSQVEVPDSADVLEARMALLENQLAAENREIVTVNPFTIKDEASLVDKIKDKRAVIRLVARDLNDAVNISYRMGELLAGYFSDSFGVYRREDFTFAVGELVRNAFLHGNRLDFRLPVYIVLDLEHQRIEVYDLAKKIEEGLDWQKKLETANKQLGGEGSGIFALQKQGWVYQLDKNIYDAVSGKSIGKRAAINRKAGEGKPGLASSSKTSSSGQDAAREGPAITGGIDLRFLPIATMSLDNLKAGIKIMPPASLQRMDLTREWSDIVRLVSSGITPSTERLKEYFAASCFKGNFDNDAGKIISCIANILRMEEENCSLTDPGLKDILVVSGSGRSGKDIKLALAK